MNTSNRDSQSQGKISDYFKKRTVVESLEEEVDKENMDIIENGEESVLCPVCSACLDGLTIDLRTSHVDTCILGPPLEEVEVNVTAVKRLKTHDNDSENSVSRSLNLSVSSVSSVSGKELKPAPTMRSEPVGSSIFNKYMPFFKVLNIGNEKLAVDAFCYGPIAGVRKYFLTHFHSDHYGGLNKNWNSGVVYCSEATSRLIQLHLDVKPEKIRQLKMNQWISVGPMIEVLLLDANHCPGSAIILFQSLDNRNILHTGDFRASPTHVDQIH